MRVPSPAWTFVALRNSDQHAELHRAASRPLMSEAEPQSTSREPGRHASEATTHGLRLVRTSDARASANPDADLTAPAGDISPVLEDLVRRFGNFMRRTAHRHGIDAAELDDVVQEARIRIWRALDTPEKINKAPASYIYRTTMSAALDLLRRRRSRREDSIDQHDDAYRSRMFATSRSADAIVVDHDIQAALERAVSLLVESRRGIVRMYLAGYDREEIASLLGWSEAKTRNLLYRGLGDVRETLTKWGYGPEARE